MKKIFFISALLLSGCKLYPDRVDVKGSVHPNPTIPKQFDFDQNHPDFDRRKVYCHPAGHECSLPGLRPKDLRKVGYK